VACMGDPSNEHLAWVRPFAIFLAAIFGCVALANGFGLLLQRPDAVPMFAALFLFITGVFAVMVQVAKPLKPANAKLSARLPASIIPIVVGTAIATIVRMTLDRWSDSPDWIRWVAYVVTLFAVTLLLNEIARRPIRTPRR